VKQTADVVTRYDFHVLAVHKVAVAIITDRPRLIINKTAILQNSIFYSWFILLSHILCTPFTLSTTY